MVGSMLHASYFGSRTCRSYLSPRFSTTVYGLRSITMNFPIWFVMAVDRGELNGIFCLTCNVSFKVCFIAMGWESGLLSLSDRHVDETKTRQTQDEFDEYSGWCLFKCMLRSYKSCRQLVLFYFSSTPSCFCHREAKMKASIKIWYDLA